MQYLTSTTQIKDQYYKLTVTLTILVTWIRLITSLKQGWSKVLQQHINSHSTFIILYLKLQQHQKIVEMLVASALSISSTYCNYNPTQSYLNVCTFTYNSRVTFGLISSSVTIFANRIAETLSFKHWSLTNYLAVIYYSSNRRFKAFIGLLNRSLFPTPWQIGILKDQRTYNYICHILRCNRNPWFLDQY